ncbi:MAG: glycosyltransferase family 2 protein [Bacteroidota bacterium]|nr:glycosyltransferase family 2 protein [Bacteroidota bacterium]
MDLSVIIPIYNEEGNIQKLHDRLMGVIDQMNLNSFEFIFINDGSRDRSMELIRGLATKNTHVHYINLSRNFGHQIAVTAGLDKSKGEAVVIIDADLQDPPELIPDLYQKLQTGFEVVYAKRNARQGEGFMKKFTAKLFYRILAKMTSISIPVDTGDFRILDRKIVDVLKQMPEQQKFLRGQISWIGFKQTFIEYDRKERNAGTTGYTYKKMIRLALDGITSFSNFPLKIVTLAGFIVSGISFFMILYALYSRFISEDYEPGWTSLMLTILFIGGIQLIGIGIIGEYISRMSANLRNRPLYIISDTDMKS